MKIFQGRVVTPGTAKAEAVVTHGGFNTLASLQSPLQFGDKTAKCGDQNNPDLYGKPMPATDHRINDRWSCIILCMCHGTTAGLYAVFKPH